MSNVPRGVNLPLSPARKFVMEVLHHARKVPSLVVEKSMWIRPLVQVRNDIINPPSWMAIFLKAYALTAVRRPELRRALIPWPWPHLYEHPQSSAVIPIERELQGETVVLCGRIRVPELRSVQQIHAKLKKFQTAPVEDINYFRAQLRIGRLPGLVRRFFFWQTLAYSGYLRARRLGTFTISSLGSLGAEQIHPLTPNTTYLSFGPIGQDGVVRVRLVYDHRVTDDRVIARCLNDLEEILMTAIDSELVELAISGAAGDWGQSRESVSLPVAATGSLAVPPEAASA
jgi:hypothetical protein